MLEKDLPISEILNLVSAERQPKTEELVKISKKFSEIEMTTGWQSSARNFLFQGLISTYVVGGLIGEEGAGTKEEKGEKGAGGQEVGGSWQDARGRRQEVGGGGRQEAGAGAGSRRQEAGGRRQEAGGRRQETGDRRQEAGDRR
jgi:hypothetical protein